METLLLLEFKHFGSQSTGEWIKKRVNKGVSFCINTARSKRGVKTEAINAKDVCEEFAFMSVKVGKGLERETRLLAWKHSQSMTCWALTQCRADLHISHMYEEKIKTPPGVLRENWLAQEPMSFFKSPLLENLYSTFVIVSCVNLFWIKMLIFRLFLNTKDQTDSAHYVIERKPRPSPKTHLTVVYLSSAFEVISLLMLPVGPELQGAPFNCSQRKRGELLRSNRFYVKGITVI